MASNEVTVHLSLSISKIVDGIDDAAIDRAIWAWFGQSGDDVATIPFRDRMRMAFVAGLTPPPEGGA
jgi:hypothetical protein